MSTTTSTEQARPQPNEHGVTWSPSRSGRIQIAVGPDEAGVGRHTGQSVVRVWAIRTGTHDLTNGAQRTFTGPGRVTEAREFANELWRTR